MKRETFWQIWGGLTIYCIAIEALAVLVTTIWNFIVGWWHF